MSIFSQFLAKTKGEFLTAFKEGDISKWTIVMGNEAGDLDSVASSAAYSYLASNFGKKQPTVALILTPRPDLYLRPENLYAFRLAGLTDKQEELLCIDDFDYTALKDAKFALVDHNSLLPMFAGKGDVVAIIDHHEDEGQHKGTADKPVDPRKIQVVGSCASLVAGYFKDDFQTGTVPPEVATFLLSATYIDTGGLKPPGPKSKTEAADLDAGNILTPVSTFNLPTTSLQGEGPKLGELAHDLHERKVDISKLSTRDLLRRDYKQFDFNTIQTGLATVPYGLKAWLEKDDAFWTGLDSYMTEKGISVLGVLTTFKSDKGHKKREILMLVDPKVVKHELEKKLFDGMVKSDLELKPKKGIEGEGDRHVRVWNQEDTDKTRKQVAPLVRKLLTDNANL